MPAFWCQCFHSVPSVQYVHYDYTLLVNPCFACSPPCSPQPRSRVRLMPCSLYHPKVAILFYHLAVYNRLKSRSPYDRDHADHSCCLSRPDVSKQSDRGGSLLEYTDHSWNHSCHD